MLHFSGPGFHWFGSGCRPSTAHQAMLRWRPTEHNQKDLRLEYMTMYWGAWGEKEKKKIGNRCWLRCQSLKKKKRKNQMSGLTSNAAACDCGLCPSQGHVGQGGVKLKSTLPYALLAKRQAWSLALSACRGHHFQFKGTLCLLSSEPLGMHLCGWGTYFMSHKSSLWASRALILNLK